MQRCDAAFELLPELGGYWLGGRTMATVSPFLTLGSLMIVIDGTLKDISKMEDSSNRKSQNRCRRLVRRFCTCRVKQEQRCRRDGSEAQPATASSQIAELGHNEKLHPADRLQGVVEAEQLRLTLQEPTVRV